MQTTFARQARAKMLALSILATLILISGLFTTMGERLTRIVFTQTVLSRVPHKLLLD